jgi:hypothetical protein
LLLVPLVLLALLQPAPAQTGGDKKKDGDTKKEPDDKLTADSKVNGKNLDEWIKLIPNPDRSLTELAIKSIITYGPELAKKAVPPLIAELKKHKPALDQPIDMSVRVNGCVALGMILGNQREPEKDAEAKKAFEKWMREQVKEAVEVLKNMLLDKQVIVRFRAAQAAAELGPMARDLLPELEKLVGDFDTWETRHAAVIALGAVAVADFRETDVKKDTKEATKDAERKAKVLDALYTRLAYPAPKYKPREACLKVRVAALDALDLLQVARVETKDRQLLLKELNGVIENDPDPYLRQRASFMSYPLLPSGDKDRKTRFAKLNGYCKHEDAAVRAEATKQTMTYLALQDKLTLLEPVAAKDSDGVIRVRTHMMIYSLLSKDGEKSARAQLIAQNLFGGDTAGRVEAAIALGHLGEEAKDTVPLLIKVLTDAVAVKKVSDKDLPVVGFSIAALKHMGVAAAKALPALKQLAEDKQIPEEIRDTALDCIETIQKLKAGGK